MNKVKLTLASILLGSIGLNAQQNLPKGTTDQEKLIERAYFENYSSNSRGITTPPTGNLRTAAEWEEVQALVITWVGYYNTIQSKIVEAAQQECEVYIVTDDQNAVASSLAANGVTPANVTYITGDYNSIWVRDYAANTVYKDTVGDVLLVDWVYNRPRPDDDAMPTLHAAEAGIDLYETTASPNDLVNTGGNWMVDGFGTAFASELINDENAAGNPYNVSTKTEAQIDGIVQDFMGIDRYIKMPVLPYDGIHHIDMHMKLLDEETLLVSEYPQGVADGPQIEANLQYVLSNFNSVYGTPYKVIRIPVPPSTGGLFPDNGGYYRTYSNNVIVNKTILLPTYREEYDTTAIRILEDAMPGYTVVGIDVDNQGENLISSSGAIHCITHTIGVEDPLLISHQSLTDTYDDLNPYQVSALVKHRSGINSATLYYKTSLSGSYSSIPMTYAGSDNWEANIPAQAAGTKVYYYVEGNATSGKTQVRPMTAPTGYWEFEVLDANSILEDENSGLSLMDIYPNPANAITAIPVNNLKAQNISIKMFDMLGNLIKVIYDGILPQGEKNFFFDAGQHPSGAYFITLDNGETKLTQKLMIK